MATALRACIVFTCGMFFVAFAEDKCAESPQEVEAEEASALDGASVQLLQLATSLEQSPGRSAQSQAGLGAGGRKHDNHRKDGEGHLLPELLAPDADLLQQLGELLPVRATEPHPKLDARRRIDRQGTNDQNREDGEDLHPPINGTELLGKWRKHLSGESLLEMGSLPGCNPDPTPTEYTYPSGTKTTNNYCGARYELWDGAEVPWNVCAVSSCNKYFYGQTCGGKFFTTADPSDESSTAVCKCCTYDSSIYKSGIGNKIYQCSDSY